MMYTFSMVGADGSAWLAVSVRGDSITCAARVIPDMSGLVKVLQ